MKTPGGLSLVPHRPAQDVARPKHGAREARHPAQEDLEEERWEHGSGDNGMNASDQIKPSIGNVAQVNHYVHLYFTHFHQHWPILHRHTFSIADEPQLLLHAVIMIGLWVSGSPAAQEGARSLHSKLKMAISAQQDNWARPPVEGEHDDEGLDSPISRWPIATYQGILLCIIFSLLSTPVSLELNLGLGLNLSDRQILSALVATCLRNNIFYYPNMLTRYRNVESITCMWVGVEEIKRFGLALYKVSRLCTRGDCLGESDETESQVLHLSALQFPMPDERNLWNASSNPELARRLLIHSRRDRSDDPSSTDWISKTGMLLENDENWWN
ncbi:hypothetical protein PDIDSM_2514 [Penicillium digitatum]|nr:hypothetical protein PDIDSM_2514 [Penicillium digitatum]